MSDTVIKVENLSKQYRLGLTGTGTLSHDLKRWWYLVRGKEDPYLKISEVNDRTTRGGTAYVWSLKDINFEVKQGEVLGIVGRNGAGKSTLLKILSKVTGPTAGKVKIKGRIASLLEVGTGFHPELTGRENVFLNGAVLGMTNKEIQSKFDEIVDFSGVERYIDTPVKRYSSGMYVRLAFAVAAHLEPEILIVDEVLAVGDAEFQKKCLGKMHDVAEHGRTVLFVSHNMAAIENLCNKGLYLKQGQIAFKGNAESSVEAYLSDFKQNMRVPLIDRKERSGNGMLRFEDVVLYNDELSKRSGNVKCGQDLTIRLMIHTDEHCLKDVRIDIGVNNEKDIRVCWLSTSMVTREPLIITRDKRSIDVKLPNLSLTPGTYSLALYAAVKGEVADWVANAYSFTVEQGDFYNIGKLPPANQGVFLANYSFNY